MRCFLAQLGPDAARQLILLREADVHGSGLISGEVDTAEKFKRILSKMLEERVPFSPDELDVSGRELMDAFGLAASPAVGELKNELWLHCVKKPSDNNRRRLLSVAKNYIR